MWQKLSNSLRAFFGSSESAQTSLLGCRAKKKIQRCWVAVYGLASIVNVKERKMMGVEKTPWERTDDDAQLTPAVT
jgi:hypothetical protein